ncbi:ABC transporter ATP-binding protein [Paenibacillus cremeus]|uniref:ABC transporter ATP-binding protein n=1 Tax=Paenibacillus cremeus TaxID=2163881 RepID=A0A559KED4_9BACL|nr:ABC transporter ATP-binding protein [Paenibacillus cremeus]TVY10478.1 ABC transporter ATP-binding protein [Paenibacillus cremeus]
MHLEVRNLRKSFDGKEVVKDISFTIKQGDLVCLLGPSGCGKTTVLNMISGLLDVTSGTIMIGGRDVTHVHPKERGIGVVFQNYALYPHMTVLENIMFPLLIQKRSKSEARDEAIKIAKMVEIDQHLHKKPAMLSGGQQQRVAIARGIVKKPGVLLLDEPLSNLDARLRLVTRENIRRIVKQFNITAIFVTHDQEEALSISDQIIVLNQGVIQQKGNPQDLYQNPNSLFVAKFMGNPPINLFEGRTDEAGKIKLDKISIDTPCKQQDVILGVRPETFRILDQASPQSVEFTVELVQLIGRDTILSGKLGGQMCKIVTETGKNNIRENSIIHLSIDTTQVMVFEKQTGARVL